MNKHTACDFKNCSFDNNQSKHDFYRDSEVMHATEKINFEKNQILLLTEKQEKKYKKRKLYFKIKTTVKLKIVVITQENIVGQPIVSATQDIKRQLKFLPSFIMVSTTTTTS